MLEQEFRGMFVGDQAVDQLADDRALDRRYLGFAGGYSVNRIGGIDHERSAVDVVIHKAVDDLSVLVVDPTRDLADRSGMGQRPKLVMGQKAVDENRSIHIHVADTDKGDVGLARKLQNTVDRILAVQDTSLFR